MAVVVIGIMAFIIVEIMSKDPVEGDTPGETKDEENLTD